MYLRFSLHLFQGRLAALIVLLLVEGADPHGHLHRDDLLHLTDTCNL